ncbi:glycosyltransferase family 4 protein [Nostoc sp. CHAB 5834]|nr:glycosyltransferase family 4 protein [Nostoc sp. CHAB 5834]
MIHFCADVRMLNNSGIGVYVQKYIQSILHRNLFEVTLIGRKKEVDFYFGAYSNWQHIEADFPIYSITEQLKLPRLIPTCDVFWSPHYNIPMLPIKARRHLVTIPDVYHLAFYHTLRLAQKVYARVVVNAATRIADKITTISQYSRKEIERYTGAPGSKIEVLYLGIDTTLFQSVTSAADKDRVKAKYKLPDQYILFVGNVKPNKNLRRLVDGFAQLLAELPDLTLVITGRQEGFITGDPDLFARIRADKALESRIVFTGFVDTPDLPVLYSSAHVFAFPSIYEGFGFPPLEAMACGCPVVASNAASIPEICGEAALYVDPLDSADIARGVRVLATDKELRERLVKTGHQQCRQYDWEVSSDRFIAMIQEMARH